MLWSRHGVGAELMRLGHRIYARLEKCERGALDLVLDVEMLLDRFHELVLLD